MHFFSINICAICSIRCERLIDNIHLLFSLKMDPNEIYGDLTYVWEAPEENLSECSEFSTGDDVENLAYMLAEDSEYENNDKKN